MKSSISHALGSFFIVSDRGNRVSTLPARGGWWPPVANFENEFGGEKEGGLKSARMSALAPPPSTPSDVSGAALEPIGETFNFLIS